MEQEPKRVQIDEELFSRLCAFFLLDRTEDENRRAIEDALQGKLQALNRRKAFTSFKESETAEERRRALERYNSISLDQILKRGR